MNIPLAMQLGLQPPHKSATLSEKVRPLDAPRKRKDAGSEGMKAAPAPNHPPQNKPQRRKHYMPGELEQRILDLLRDRGPMSASRIAETVGRRLDNAVTVLRRLEQAGKTCCDDLQNWHLSSAGSDERIESAPARERLRQGEMEQRVREILKDAAAQTKRQIADAIGTTPANLGHVLRRMRDDGAIVQDRFYCWSLSSADPSPAPQPAHIDPPRMEPPRMEPAPVPFRFSVWDDDSLLIVATNTSVELPLEAARRLAAFLNSHFTDTRIR